MQAVIQLSSWEQRDNLRAELTSFVGRQTERDVLTRLVRSQRLLTLVGAPGVGKTRLALQVAREALTDYSAGVYLVELAALHDPGLVAQAVADVLRLREQGRCRGTSDCG